MRWLSVRLARFLRARDGTAATEFAIISIPLVMLMIGTIDFGRVMFTHNGLSHAADTAARLILLDNNVSNAEVISMVREAFTAGPGDELSVSVSAGTESGVDYRTIAITYDINLVTPFIDDDAITLSHERRVPLVN